MTNLLSNIQNRQLLLLEYLEQYERVSQKLILKHLNYNEKTLKSDISIINELIAPLCVINQNHRGIELFIPNNYNFDYVYSCFLSESNEYEILELIFFDESHSLNSLSEKLYLSISTLRRIINKINTRLEKSDIRISSQPLALVGNEKHIYILMIRYFFEKYTPVNYPFTSNQIKCIEHIIEQMAERNGILLHYPDINRFKVWILTIAVRLKNGNFPRLLQLIPHNIDTSITNDQDIVQSFKILFNLPLNIEILSYLFQFLFIKDYALNFTILQQLAFENKHINTKLNTIEHIINILSNEFKLPLENKKSLLLEVYNTTLLLGPDSFLLNNRNKKLVDDLTRHSTRFLDILNIELAKLFTNKDLMENNLYVLAYCLTTHWPQLSLQLHQFQTKLRVGLFFYTTKEHTQYIKDEILYHFHQNLQVDIIFDLNLVGFKKNAPKYDIVITNIYGLEIDDVSVVCFPFAPTIRDYKILEDIIENTSHENL